MVKITNNTASVNRSICVYTHNHAIHRVAGLALVLELVTAVKITHEKPKETSGVVRRARDTIIIMCDPFSRNESYLKIWQFEISACLKSASSARYFDT